LDVVGGPVIDGNVVLVDNVTPQHALELSAVDPMSGKVLWSDPYSASQTTAGVFFSPVDIGNVALVLAPAASLSNPDVYPEGVNIETGKVIWKLTQSLDLSDAPLVCGQDILFCFPAFVSEKSTDLVALSPATGAIIGALAGPFRNVGAAVPGLPDTSTLWQTDASSETLMQTSPIDKPLWSRTISSLFGGTKYSMSDGWDFVENDGIDIGTVGVLPSGHTEPFGEAENVGIDPNSGAVKWRAPGSLYCSGPLQFLLPLVNCKFAGVATFSNKTTDLDRVTLDLTGISTASGKPTWSQPVKDVRSLVSGTGVAFSDTSHLVIETMTGKWKLLDVQNGTLTSIAPHTTFWCEEAPFYHVTPIQGLPGSGERQSEPVYTGCTKRGKVTKGIPSGAPITVGVAADNMFIWPTPNGLRGHHVN
jgi:hypothetical protein